MHSDSESDHVVVYRPIGIIECSIAELHRPEVIRVVESRLVLEPNFALAIAALEVGQYYLKRRIMLSSLTSHPGKSSYNG